MCLERFVEVNVLASHRRIAFIIMVMMKPFTLFQITIMMMNQEGWMSACQASVLFSEAEEKRFRGGNNMREIINRVWIPLVLFLKFLDFEPVDEFHQPGLH